MESQFFHLHLLSILIHELVKQIQFFMFSYISSILLYLLLMYFKVFIVILNEIF